MNEEKHSDQILRDKLTDYTVDPPEHIWTNIQDQLLKIKRNQRILYIRWMSAAAAILIAFLGGWYFSRNTETLQTVSTEKSDVQQKDNSINKDVEPEINAATPVQYDHEFLASAGKTEQKEEKTKNQTVASIMLEEQDNVATL